MMSCPHCASAQVVKNGQRNGKQSYLCCNCRRQFRENPELGYSAEVKALCVKMSLNGMGFRAIERVTGINHNSVINWVRQAAAAIADDNYQIPETAQLDELETFVGKKKQNLAVDGREYEVPWHC
jgi:transposase-like protein